MKFILEILLRTVNVFIMETFRRHFPITGSYCEQ